MISEAIHVHWFRMEDDLIDDREAVGLLDAQERERLRRFQFNDAARFFAYRRAMVRLVLANYLDQPAAMLEFITNENGKPAVAGQQRRVHFSTSQTGECGVVALGFTDPLGVDVEVGRPIGVAAFANSILSPSERIVHQALVPEEQQSSIFTSWTAKEAVIKGLGAGLEMSLLPRISVDATAVTEPACEPGVDWYQVTLPSSLPAEMPWHVCNLSGSEALPTPFPQPAFLSVATPEPRPINITSAKSFLS